MRGIIAIAGLMFVVGCGAIADNPRAVNSLAGGTGTLVGEAAGDSRKGTHLGKAAGEAVHGASSLLKQAELSKTRVISYPDGSYIEIVPTGKRLEQCIFVELFHYNLKGELLKKEQAQECPKRKS